jgi:hypothetical protein
LLGNGGSANRNWTPEEFIDAQVGVLLNERMKVSRGLYIFVCTFATILTIYVFSIVRPPLLGWVIAACALGVIWIFGFRSKGWKKALWSNTFWTL